MNDCANAEIRDRLPDLVHGTLPPTESSAVELHLQGCADCRAEVVVIRGLRDMLVSRSRAVDVASIVSALPSRRGTSSVSRGWRSSWRVAAAVLIVATGAGALAFLNHGSTTPVATRDIALVAADVPVPGDSQGSPMTSAQEPSGRTAPIALSPSTTASGAEMTVATSVGSLTDSQVDALIDRIQTVEAIPLPEPVHPKVTGVWTDSIGIKDLGGSR